MARLRPWLQPGPQGFRGHHVDVQGTITCSLDGYPDQKIQQKMHETAFYTFPKMNSPDLKTTRHQAMWDVRSSLPRKNTDNFDFGHLLITQNNHLTFHPIFGRFTFRCNCSFQYMDSYFWIIIFYCTDAHLPNNRKGPHPQYTKII